MHTSKVRHVLVDFIIAKVISLKANDKSGVFEWFLVYNDGTVKSKGESHLHLGLQSFSDLSGHFLGDSSLLGLGHRIDLISSTHHKISRS